MKRLTVLFFIITCALVLASCGRDPFANLQIDYGTSSLYSQQEMDEAIMLIKKEFSSWKGCELHSITYAGDEFCSQDNIDWMNELSDGQEVFTECIMFKSDFHTPKNGSGSFNSDYEYTNWQWWLAREEGGKWKLKTWGY